MKIPQCKDCVGKIIGCKVSNGNLHIGGSACENFHKALVKKFTSTNTGMDVICTFNKGERMCTEEISIESANGVVATIVSLKKEEIITKEEAKAAILKVPHYQDFLEDAK